MKTETSQSQKYNILVNKERHEWQKQFITGLEIKSLAGVDPEIHDAWQDEPGSEDRLMEDADKADLAQPGIERFITALRTSKVYEIIVNARPHTVEDEHVTFEQVVQLAFPGPQDPNVIYSMTYRHAASKPHAGELAAGGAVDVKKKGTVFNVTPTVKS